VPRRNKLERLYLQNFFKELKIVFQEPLQCLGSCGLYYKHTMIVNYASSVINKLEALLTDDARVIIYDRHVFVVQATDFTCKLNRLGLKKLFLPGTNALAYFTSALVTMKTKVYNMDARLLQFFKGPAPFGQKSFVRTTFDQRTLFKKRLVRPNDEAITVLTKHNTCRPSGVRPKDV
jgi:hypothetical protein